MTNGLTWEVEEVLMRETESEEAAEHFEGEVEGGWVIPRPSLIGELRLSKDSLFRLLTGIWKPTDYTKPIFATTVLSKPTSGGCVKFEHVFLP